MSVLADRLRGIVRAVESKEGQPLPEEGRPSVRPADAARILDGERRVVQGREFLVIDRTYLPGHRHGDVVLADTLPPEDRSWPRLPLLNNVSMTVPQGRMLFVDLETTGLAGGAGTYAFLIGCAWYQNGCLRVRQFFLSDFGAERLLLEAFAELAGQAGAVVTYNGKSFDLPLIDTRFVLHRMETPFAGIPHIDMLHPARRLWRQDDNGDSGCSLAALEQSLCGYVREGDVPGFEIPSRYFRFVRSGDARGLAAVMEHNRLDLVSLAMLTAQASQLLEDGPAAARTAREALASAASTNVRPCRWRRAPPFSVPPSIAMPMSRRGPTRGGRTPCCRGGNAVFRTPPRDGAAFSSCADARQRFSARPRRHWRFIMSIASGTSKPRGRSRCSRCGSTRRGRARRRPSTGWRD